MFVVTYIFPHSCESDTTAEELVWPPSDPAQPWAPDVEI